MHTNPSWKDYFIFSKKDKRIVVPAVFLFVIFGAFILFYSPKPEVPVIRNLDEELTQLSLQQDDSNAVPVSSISSDKESLTSAVVLFYFDPNTIGEEEWKRLGVRSKTIHTIFNYRSKGGHFYKPDDLRKIYGLSEEEANRLVPYVKIKTTEQASGSFIKEDGADPSSSFYLKQKPQVIDINSATIEQWKALPAIGDALSARIVKYRDKIGGFTSLGQVKQTYGLSDSAFTIILPYLRLSAGGAVAQPKSSPQKININKATADELKSNPAISPDIAEAIVVYRGKHGKYSSVTDIKRIVFINDDIYQKIAPLLTTE